jgi:hypothetical protein
MGISRQTVQRRNDFKWYSGHVRMAGEWKALIWLLSFTPVLLWSYDRFVRDTWIGLVPFLSPFGSPLMGPARRKTDKTCPLTSRVPFASVGSWCLEQETNSPSPAQRRVHAGARKAISYQ